MTIGEYAEWTFRSAAASATGERRWRRSFLRLLSPVDSGIDNGASANRFHGACFQKIRLAGWQRPPALPGKKSAAIRAFGPCAAGWFLICHEIHSFRRHTFSLPLIRSSGTPDGKLLDITPPTNNTALSIYSYPFIRHTDGNETSTIDATTASCVSRTTCRMPDRRRFPPPWTIEDNGASLRIFR